MDDIYCIFLGGLDNLCTLNKQYGLTKLANEPMFVIQAYKTLRDRGPYPAHSVLREMEGSFGFILYDLKAKTVFVSLVSVLSLLILSHVSCYKEGMFDILLNMINWW